MFWATLAVVLLLHAHGCLCCPGHERDSLLHFKASVFDPSNQVPKSWHGFNCCEWKGIQCHPHTHHVIRLDLHSSWDVYDNDMSLSNLTSGDVLSPLFNLEHLQHLDLRWNNFCGVPIPPGLDRLRSLRYLDLSHSGFRGDIPRELGNMSSLHYLDLSGNYDLTMVSMRAWAGNMINLRELILEGVNMSRVNSDDLENALSATMYSLTRLHLSDCELHGAVLPSLTNLRHLTHLDLSLNDFNGSIPSALLSLPRLQLLDLSGNSDLGGKLSSILPQHSASLHTLDLSETSVGGSIPNSVANISSLAVLDLSYCNVESSIPITIANLTALKRLHLSNNMLRGHIPPFWNRSALFGRPFSLEDLDLSQNQLDGPIPPTLFTTFPNLQIIDLSYNQLTGSIPSAAGSIISLCLSGNALTGTIPSSIGQLSSLHELDLSNNKLEGIIPLNISNLSNIGRLHLQSNRLSGDFSESHLHNLRQLYKIDISDNLLTVKFSPTWIPKFSLEMLALRSCDMEASGFPTFLITQYEVGMVDLSNNSLAGDIPQWIWSLNSLSCLNLSHNNFAGVLPDSLAGFYILDLHSNNLQGRLPLIYGLSVLDVSENQLGGSIPAGIGGNIQYLSLSGNHLNGSIPPSIYQIPFVDLSNNKLTGNINPANLKNCSFMKMLNLENNYLEGKLPRQLANMPYLEILKLGANGLNSSIPSSLLKCKQLQILDLNSNNMTGTIPTWIGKLSNLKILILRSNRFEGKIPSQVTNLPLIQILDLSSNRFSGIIPANISSLQAMKNQTVTTEIFNFETITYIDSPEQIHVDSETIINKAREMEFVRSLALVKCIDLSNNNLTGGIPQNIGLLEGLIILNISRNHITGEIPKSLGKMLKLESLDFSHNRLSGNIPVELQLLTFVGYLDLSHNNLSGKIPQGGQLLTFEASSFSNNSGLCGLQLNTTCCGLHQEKPCPESVRPEITSDEIDEEEDYDIWWGVGLGMSYAVGFSIVIGVLCLTTIWSRKCFHMMDMIIIYLFERFRT